MHPILFEFAGRPVYSYGFFIALGYLAALYVGRGLAKSRGLNPAPFMDVAFLGIVTGIFGARIFFIAQNIPYFSAHPDELLDVRGGGLVFYGGFFLATPSALLYGWWKKMPIQLSCDIVFASVALAQAFGRLGCFAAGCCYGSYCPYPWGIHLPSDLVAPNLRDQPLHPTQLYESAGLFVLAALLLWLVRKRKLRAGSTTLVYVGGYALLRFIVEYFRGDEDRGYLLGTTLSVSQAIAIPLFLGSGALLFRRIRAKNL